MNIPEELKYTKDHEWIRLDGDTATIGITDFAQGELGDIVFIDVPSIGNTVNGGEVFGSVEAVKTVSDLYMPVSGTVKELNPLLETNSEKVNEDPYGDGWIIKATLAPGTESKDLLTAAEYRELIGQ